jgi:hypothetical protein
MDGMDGPKGGSNPCDPLGNLSPSLRPSRRPQPNLPGLDPPVRLGRPRVILGNTRCPGAPEPVLLVLLGLDQGREHGRDGWPKVGSNRCTLAYGCQLHLSLTLKATTTCPASAHRCSQVSQLPPKLPPIAPWCLWTFILRCSWALTQMTGSPAQPRGCPVQPPGSSPRGSLSPTFATMARPAPPGAPQPQPSPSVVSPTPADPPWWVSLGIPGGYRPSGAGFELKRALGAL